MYRREVELDFASIGLGGSIFFSFYFDFNLDYDFYFCSDFFWGDPTFDLGLGLTAYFFFAGDWVGDFEGEAAKVSLFFKGFNL